MIVGAAASFLRHEMVLGIEAMPEGPPRQKLLKIPLELPYQSTLGNQPPGIMGKGEIRLFLIWAPAILRLCDLPLDLSVANGEMGNVCEAFLEESNVSLEG